MIREIFVMMALLGTLGLSSCATNQPGVLMSETPASMTDSRKAIISVIGPPRFISENGHELLSHYYDTRGLNYEPGKSTRERFYTHVLILGDRRPYDIRIIVVVEEKQGAEFHLVGYDNEKAQRLSERIKKALTESRDNRNVIDDFKPY
jgi:hypothetical protein